MKRKELCEIANVSIYILNELNKGENVTTDILKRICKVRECNIGDIVDVVSDTSTAQEAD